MTLRLRTWLSALLVVVIMTAIFIYSAQPGGQSSANSYKATKILLRVFYDESEIDTMDVAVLENIETILRKAAHIAEYMILTVCVLLHITSGRRKRDIRYNAALTVAIGVFYASSDELHQLFVEGRNGTPVDVLIDSIGIIAVVCIYVLSVRFISHRKAAAEE